MISALKEINRVLRQKERGEFTLHVMDTKVLAEEKIFKKRSKVLSEVKSDREGEISYGIPCMWNLKRNNRNELIYKLVTDSQTLRMNLWLSGGKNGRKR